MSLKDQLSFASGEIDPILHDRVTLQRFQNGLDTARNVIVGKTGSIKSRFATKFLRQAPYNNKPVRIYSPPNSGVYFLVTLDGSNNAEIQLREIDTDALLVTHTQTTNASPSTINIDANDLETLQFVDAKGFVYIFYGSSRNFIFKASYQSPYTLLYRIEIFGIPEAPTNIAYSGTVAASSYGVDYAFTKVIDGEESQEIEALNADDSNLVKPQDIGDEIAFTITIDDDTGNLDKYNEVRAYRRPAEGAAYGFIGRTSNIYIDGTEIKAGFTDIGALADFANGIPRASSQDGLNMGQLPAYPVGTGIVYQQRLILANFFETDPEAIVASRPGQPNNFFRDFPLSADSALKFKASSTGTAKVLRMIESDGLVIFTTIGVFVSVGPLSPNNLVLEKRGGWVIDEKVEPLNIPGALLFVDKTTGSIRQLVYSQELATYDSIDQSIYSDHLFKDRKITSWAFQQGSAPVLVVTFSDGEFATFTYNFEHKMRAWTRHDSRYPVEQVVSTGRPDEVLFVVNKDGQREIHKSVPRTANIDTITDDSEYYMGETSALMDGMHVEKTLLNDSLSGSDTIEVSPVVAGEWDGDLTLNSGTSGVFAGVTVGFVYRYFNPDDRTFINLEVKTVTSNDEVVVIPSEEFPEKYKSNPNIYETFTSITGLDYLKGEKVSLLVDGNVIGSPNNDHDDDSVVDLTVDAGTGKLTIPEEYRAAIAVVGRPVTADIKTLNVSTVSQAPTIVESLTVNKLYLRVFDTRGLFVDNKFPENKTGDKDGNSVDGMQNLDNFYVPNNTDIIGNRFKQPVSRRIEVTLPGEWESNGKMSIRQVDPIHFDILSVIADIEVLRRSNR